MRRGNACPSPLRRSTRWLRATAQVAGLWALVVAQPLLDPLSRAPEFFVAHRADAWDLGFLAVQIVAAGPLVFALLAAAATPAGPKAVDLLTASVVGLLLALFGAQVGYRAGVSAWTPTMVVVAACAAAGVYAWWHFRGVRLTLNVLAASAIVVPGLFLGSSDIRPLLRSGSGPAATRNASDLPPVVVLVFDELPLVSLLDGSGRLDAVRFPHLAALAADGVWFRNATTVSDFTRWALPAIVSGRYPKPQTVPTAANHPDTLFTALAPTHRMEVVEPLTAICPSQLCSWAETSRAGRQRRLLADVGVVAQHALLPPVAREGLPDLTHGWSGFVDDDNPLRAGRRSDGKKDHVAIASSFIAGTADGDEQPTLYFLHTIVSHHPPHLLPSGQRIASFVEPPAMTRDLTWLPSTWPVTLYHQGAIVQAGLVDTLVGKLRTRLEQAELYDRTLLIVTSDHGISFTPGAPVRYLSRESAAGIMPVPLIVKLPSTRLLRPKGLIDDRNVESIDILPTIADVLGVRLPAAVDGRSAFAPGPDRPEKRLYYQHATAMRTYAPGEVARMRDREAARNVSIFGPDRWPAPVPGRGLRALLDRPLSGLAIETVASAPRVILDEAEALRDVDLSAPALPVQVRGRVASGRREQRDAIDVVVALNGRVAAVTRTWSERGTWMALLDPDRLRDGFNDLETFTVDPERPTTLVTRRTWRELPDGFDLMSESAEQFGVSRSGFHRREIAGETPFHWTRGTATFTVPAGKRFGQLVLETDVLFSGPGGKRLRILVNDCEVLSEPLAGGRWTHSAPIGRCAPPGRWATIQLQSDVHRAGADTRRLGVALSRLVLRSAGHR